MAGGAYNPGTPAIIGEQWMVDMFGNFTLGSVAQRMRSRSAETINRIDAWMLPSFLADTQVTSCEIMPLGSETPSGTVTTATYHPDADIANLYWVGFPDNVNLYTNIDEGTATPDLTNGVLAAQQTPAAFGQYSFHVNSAAFPFTARVLDVKARVVANRGFGPPGGLIGVGVESVGTSIVYYPSGSALSLGVNDATYDVDFGEINPSTLLPWTPADIRGFDTGTNLYGIVLLFQPVACGYVKAVDLIVTYQTFENRVACATLYKVPLPNQQLGNYQFQQFCGLPSGTTWAKPASGDFTFLFRPARYPFGSSPAGAWSMLYVQARSTINGYQDCTVPGVMSAIPMLDLYGQVTNLSYTGFDRTRIVSFVMRTTAPAVSQDSQAYAAEFGLAFDPWPNITASQSVRQYFTAPQSATYSFIRLVLLPGVATGNLSVKIRRQSDDLQFGSTITVDPDDVRAQTQDGLGTGFRIVPMNMTSGAVLVNGTQYYLELTTTDTTASSLGWKTVALGADPMAAGTASWNSTTDFMRIGSTNYANKDMPMQVYVPPTAPVGATAVAHDQTNHVVAGVQGCVPTAIQAITLTWTATALGVLFDHYEVSRKRISDPETAWAVIAALGTSEAATSFVDYETARNVPYEYRVRVVRTDTAASAWSTPSNGATAASKGCEMIFTTNEDPALAVAFDRTEEQDTTFQSAARDEIIQIYGSNYSVAFMECENVGDQFPATLTVNFGHPPSVPDRSIFQPLRDISRAAVSYVCVMDWTGNQWLAHLQVGVGKWVEPGWQYTADVVITEVSDVPSTVAG